MVLRIKSLKGFARFYACGVSVADAVSMASPFYACGVYVFHV